MVRVSNSTTKLQPDDREHKAREPEIWPYVFWAGVAAIAFVTAVGVSLPWLQTLLEGSLWCIAVFFATVMAFAISELPWFSSHYRGSWPVPPADPAKDSWIRKITYGVTVLSLTAGGYYWLAGLFFALPFAVDGYRLYGQVLIGGKTPDAFRPADRAVYWLTITLAACIRAVFRALSALVMCPWLIRDYLRYRRSDQKLLEAFREEFGDRDVLIYLLFSERHQLSRFLGEGGVLHPFLDHVLARDWSSQVMADRRAQGWAKFRLTAEGEILRRFGISNMRDHLPFVLVVERGGCFGEYHLSRPYRRRVVDKGHCLSVYEAGLRGRIEAALERAAQAPGSRVE